MNSIGKQRYWVWRGWQIRYSYLLRDSRREAIPILFLHGFGSSLGQWRYVLEPLSARHGVYAVDLLGFGRSQKAPERYGAALWMAQVYDFWRSWINRPMILVGHSLGGSVALAIADTYPAIVQGLVLFTLPPSRAEFFRSPLQAKLASLESILTPSFLLPPLFRLLFYRPWLESIVRQGLRSVYVNKTLVDQDLVNMIVTPPQDPGAVEVLCRLFQSKNKPEYIPHVGRTFPRLKMPILLVWGQQDPIFSIDQGRQLVEQNPWATLVEIEQAGHCAYDEQPDRVTQVLLAWIEEI